MLFLPHTVVIVIALLVVVVLMVVVVIVNDIISLLKLAYFMAQTAVLTVKNLHKEYRPGKPRCLGLSRSSGSSSSGAGGTMKVAVDDSSFAVDAGEIFGLLGPNGAGKSTTLNAIIAETRPTWGQVGISCVKIKQIFEPVRVRCDQVLRD